MRQVIDCGAFRAEIDDDNRVHLSMPEEVIAKRYERVGGRSWMDYIEEDLALLMVKIVFDDTNRVKETTYAV